MAAYTTINKPSLYFNTKLYTGNGSTNAITGVGHQPDFTWIKRRDSTGNHGLYDAVRGVLERLQSDQTSAEATTADSLTAFGTDGFTMGSNSSYNGSSQTYASWNWKAGGGQGSSNTDGSINTTYTSVNTTAGFSISKYTGTGNAGTVGHGLGVAPKVIIIKNISQTTDWVFGHQELDASAPWTKYLELNSNVAVLDNTVFNDTAPTNSVFSVGGDGKVSSGAGSHVAYCFAEKRGYSKFSSYTGNGNADGPFIYTGFKPAFVLTKTATSTYHWSVNDNKRNTFNPSDKRLYPSQNNAEATSDSYDIDFLSNGFKIKSSSVSFNNSGDNVIYMAFAENPLVDSTGKIPATAR